MRVCSFKKLPDGRFEAFEPIDNERLTLDLWATINGGTAAYDTIGQFSMPHGFRLWKTANGEFRAIDAP